MSSNRHSQAKIKSEIEQAAGKARSYTLLVRQYLDENDYHNAARCASAVHRHALEARTLNTYLNKLGN